MQALRSVMPKRYPLKDGFFVAVARSGLGVTPRALIQEMIMEKDEKWLTLATHFIRLLIIAILVATGYVAYQAVDFFLTWIWVFD